MKRILLGVGAALRLFTRACAMPVRRSGILFPMENDQRLRIGASSMVCG